MGLRDRMRRLECLSEGEMVVIPQAYGTVRRFLTSALKDAFLVNVNRICGEDVEPHPLSLAIQNAAHRATWHDSFFDMVEVGEGIEDLSDS